VLPWTAERKVAIALSYLQCHDSGAFESAAVVVLTAAFSNQIQALIKREWLKKLPPSHGIGDMMTYYSMVSVVMTVFFPQIGTK
jgi:hypothetical protein